MAPTIFHWEGNSQNFWATICKMVRPMLSDRRPGLFVLSCPVCLSVLSVTLVYCDQTARCINLAMWVSLGPGHFVLDGDTAPLPQRGSAPRGVARWWTGVNMSTPLLPEAVPEIDANPVSLVGGRVEWG